VADLAQEIRLMDIALMPAARNCGIGGNLCCEMMDRATHLDKIVSLHVEEDNPAKHLYERLGFVEAGEVSFYKLMHWCPQGLAHISEALSAQLNTAS
jgi:ribosomal protein S18 acetylase RimI-like enzyme